MEVTSLGDFSFHGGGKIGPPFEGIEKEDKMAVILKDAEYRHNSEGIREVEATLYADSLSGLPTEASDIDGLLPDDVLAAGSTALEMSTGALAMFDGSSWAQW